MTLCSPFTDLSSATSAVQSPDASDSSSSFPVSADARQQNDGRVNCTCIQDEESYLEEGHCSTSLPSNSQTASQLACCVDVANDAGLDQCVTGGSYLHLDQGLKKGTQGIDDGSSGQPCISSSGSDGDVEKGRDFGNTKQVDVDEEGLGDCCRVCHLSVERSPNAGDLIKLGCACKNDLALAHQHCAETWFRIKGNWTCEICGSEAQNIKGHRDSVQLNVMEGSHSCPTRAERCWQNQPIFNTLVVCVLLILIASWLFRVTLF